MGEPIYHYMTTPTAIAAAGSREAGIFAVAQAMWDWSFVQYCMYAICGAAFAIICYNRKKSLNFNSIIECTTGKKTPWAEHFAHGYSYFLPDGWPLPTPWVLA